MSSVSRVLSGHPDVSPAMSEKVMAAVAELDYQPDMLAQSLRRRETLTVGFVVGDISNPLLAEIVIGVESTLHANGYSMLLTNSLGDPLLEAAHIALLSHRRVDGLVISVLDETHPETIGRLAELDIPIVVLDRNLPPEIPVSRVLSDHRSGMKAAGAPPARPRPSTDRADRRQRRPSCARAPRRARGGVRRARACRPRTRSTRARSRSSTAPPRCASCSTCPSRRRR